jgi:hypothetical protein
MANESPPSPTGSGGLPTMAEVVDVLRPQVEKIEEGFKAIRIALEALADHLSRMPAATAEKPVKRAAPPTPLREPPEEPRPRPVAKTAVPAAASPEPVRVPPAVPPDLPPSPEPPPLPVASPPSYPGEVGRGAPVAPVLPPAAPAAPPSAPVRAAAPAGIPVSGGGGAGNWSAIVFGTDTASNPAVAYLSSRLLAEVYAGDNDAMGLIGQLLDFRSANGERRLRMLKDIGEAFYRWKPTGDERLRDALIAWVHALLDREGIPNRVAIVQAGDRYDMQMHNAKERGIEVADVYGWVVLRENGKVYSKANVSVK